MLPQQKERKEKGKEKKKETVCKGPRKGRLVSSKRTTLKQKQLHSQVTLKITWTISLK